MTKQPPAAFALFDDIRFKHETVTVVSRFTVVPGGPWVYVIRREVNGGYVCEIHPEEVLLDGEASRGRDK